LVYGKHVDVDWQKQDRYGRTVGKVIINGLDANLEQIKRGMAWFYRNYQSELVMGDRLDYLRAEEGAQVNRVGLWVDKESPWRRRISGLVTEIK
jgi:endonuclease YncB( thermonuclease family)